MNWLKRLFSAIAAYFSSGKAAKDAATALHYVKLAAPYVTIVGDIATKYIIHTPAEVDDIVWAGIKMRLPSLFDGKQHTEDEIKADMIRALAIILQSKFDALSDMSVALFAAQGAYLEARAQLSAGK